MFTMTDPFPSTTGATPTCQSSTRPIWKGLELKAENALPFVPEMTKCDTIERGDNYLVRNIVFRGEPASERVTFYPKRMVQFDRLSGSTLGTIKNEIEEDASGELSFRFTFSLEKEGIRPLHPKSKHTPGRWRVITWAQSGYSLCRSANVKKVLSFFAVRKRNRILLRARTSRRIDSVDLHAASRR